MMEDILRIELKKIGIKDFENLEKITKELNTKRTVIQGMYEYVENWLNNEKDPDISGELLIQRQNLSVDLGIIERCLELIEEL